MRDRKRFQEHTKRYVQIYPKRSEEGLQWFQVILLSHLLVLNVGDWRNSLVYSTLLASHGTTAASTQPTRGLCCSLFDSPPRKFGKIQII